MNHAEKEDCRTLTVQDFLSARW